MEKEFKLEEWELPPGCREPLAAPSEPDPQNRLGDYAARVVKAAPFRWIVFVSGGIDRGEAQDGGRNRVVCKYFEGPVVWREPPRSDKLGRIVHRALCRESLRLGRLFVLP